MKSARGRVVVSGGTGFIGAPFVRMLASLGYSAVVLTRDPKLASARLPRNVVAAPWDGRSLKGWGSLVDGATAVVNLAGASIAQGRWTEERKRAIVESRLRAGETLCGAVERAAEKPRVFIQGSAVGWYGPRGDEELDEASKPGRGFLAETARAWEPSTVAVEAMGVRRAVVRLGMVLGPGGGALEKFLPPFRLFLGGPLGSGRQWVSWVHREDVLRALVYLIEHEKAAGVFNLTAPAPVTMREFCRELGQALHRPSWLPVPGFALRAALGEMAAELVLGGQRVIPRKLGASGFRFNYPGVARALAACIAERGGAG
ncbi:MAG: TIGR01777 family protein [Desulfovibrionaceae bacterium]|jgi:uncharacterized protein (TIGR01777 family)|nr:TIGR01777 family protein [Desulfovibrionaceae bacterium]